MKQKWQKIIVVALLISLLLSSTSFAVTKWSCVGDSITEGNANAHPEVNSWPYQLGRMLAGHAPGKWEVRNFGKSGATLLKKGHKPYWDQPQFEAALAFAQKSLQERYGAPIATNPDNPDSKEHEAEVSIVGLGKLGGAARAVAHHSFDEARIDGAAAHDPGER